MIPRGVMMKLCVKSMLLILLLTYGTSAYSSSLRTVRLQLKWKHQYQFAGYYAAIEKGYYHEVGLNVQLLEATSDETPFSAVASGKADFGTCTTDILVARSKGYKPVVLANIFQHSPHIIIAKESSGIRVVHDLANKRIASEPDAADLYAFLLSEGMKPENLHVEDLNFGLDKFIKGEVDAITAYSTDEVYPLREAGFKFNVLWPTSSGIDYYGDLLFTDEMTIRKHPVMVEQFRKASLKGWAYALSNQEEMVNLIYSKYSRRHTMDHLRFEARETYKLIQPDVVEIGYTNPGRWEKIIDSYKSLDFIDQSLSTKGLLYADYLPHPFRVPWRVIASLAIAFTFALILLLIFYRSSKRLKREVQARKLMQEQLSTSNVDLNLLRSELQEKNAFLTGVMESMHEIVFSVDNQLRYTSFNSQHEKYMREAYQAEIHLGDKVIDYLTGQPEKEQLELNINKALAGEFCIVDYFTGADLGAIYLEVSFAPLFDDNREIIGATVLAKDITSRKVYESKLKSLNEDLETRVHERTQQLTAALEEIDDFAYSLSHDLRTPLRGIDGFSSVLMDDYSHLLDDNAIKHLQSIRQDAQKLGDVLDALHHLSNVSRKEIVFARINLSDLASVVLTNLIPDISATNITYTIQPGLYAMCDKKLLTIAMEHLMGNALKFTSRNTNPFIEFGEIIRDGVPTYFVRDNGIGFNMDYVNKLFHNFQRLHTNSDYEGLGIGLATVRRIVIKHGGIIWAESTPGNGATFFFTLTWKP